MDKLAEILYSTPAGAQWQHIGVRHHHGINLSLASIHSSDSGGIGEYLDLIPLINWCSRIGFDVIQLLPINDSASDPSPYSSLSAFALHPIYLSLRDLPYIEEDLELQNDSISLQELKAGRKVLYHQVLRKKELALRNYLERHRKELLSNDSYQKFVEKQRWLKPYALFKALKQLNCGLHWKDWGINYEDLAKTDLKVFQKEMEYHSLLQFFCFEQMKKVKAHGERHKVFLKGDIPILVSADSADVWSNPSLFQLDVSAGAPPDMYAKEGQNWGFPTYNWGDTESKGYSFWKERLDVAAEFYSLYRLDHVVGFYRIWTIPKGKNALEGRFDPIDPSLWIAQGEKILRLMLEHSPMLPIAEDLGSIPPNVRLSLQNLGISGTKVMRWERNWGGDELFIDPKIYHPLSMTTVSTHDSMTKEQWWRDCKDEAKMLSQMKNWSHEEVLSKERRHEILQESHSSASLFHINLLQEYFPLIPSMAWPTIDHERINTPGIVSENNWTYRCRPSIEKIVGNEALEELMKVYSKLSAS